MRTSVPITVPEPTRQDLDRLIRDLERSWVATVTVRRQSPSDVGYREIFVSIDGGPPALLRHGDSLTREVTPGPHRLEAHNTLFRKKLQVTLLAGEHATFSTVNRAGWGTYSPLAFFIGFLGAGPFYLDFVRDGDAPRG
jgi:hypothetical protein